MAAGFWGKKIGMTQLFVNDRVVPVTAVDVSNWIVFGIKTPERDGYSALQIGMLKDRYAQLAFSAEWLKKPTQYFSHIREIPMIESVTVEDIGKPVNAHTLVATGDMVEVTGKTVGRGFQGVIKRHGFKGPPGSHGSCMGRRPGASSSYRSQGRVIKGKRFPGHMGHETCMVEGLEVIRIEEQDRVVFLKGSVPGKSGALLSIAKV